MIAGRYGQDLLVVVKVVTKGTRLMGKAGGNMAKGLGST